MNTGGDTGAGGAVTIGDASTGGDVVTPPAGACSDKGANPTPKAPFAKADPIDTKFPFSTHWMGMFTDNPQNARCISMTSLTDLDKDGDLDFADGQRDVACSGSANPNAPMLWWEYCTPDHWVRHTVGTGFASAASGGAGDFDGDGFIDLVAGNSWFKNPGAGVQTAASWMRYPTGAPGATEEIAMGDLNGDGRLDALYVVSSIDPQWWTGGTNPMTNPWAHTVLSTNRQQQGAAIGDLDGDGKNDAIVGDHWWYRAPTWTPVAFATDSSAGAPAFVALGGFEPNGTPAAGSAPLTMVGDMDGDGDNDIAMSTHWGANVAWMENKDAKGTAWVLHMVPATGRGNAVLHDVVADDFDNDGDLDILVAENQGNLWIYENSDGKGLAFTEHKIAIGPGHEARAADVDCDGDLDIVGKSWSDPGDGRAGASEIAALLGHHVYYKNELVEKGAGPPLFVRPKGEVWNVPNKGKCK
jgi:FG-GAP-like repeat